MGARSEPYLVGTLWQVPCSRLLHSLFKNIAHGVRDSGPPRVWRGPGANCFRGPFLKIFSGKIVFRTTTTVFQRLYLNFSYKISVLCPKKPTNILPFARKYFTQKITGAQQKISRGPSPPPPSGDVYRAGLKNVVGSIPTVARHIFQACPVWIYTQSNITSILFT